MKERIRQEQEEEKQRLEAEMQRLMALEEDHRKKVQIKEQEMGRIKEDLEKKWDRERRQVLLEYFAPPRCRAVTPKGGGRGNFRGGGD